MSCCAIGRPSFGKRYGKNKPRDTVKPDETPAQDKTVQNLEALIPILDKLSERLHEVKRAANS